MRTKEPVVAMCQVAMRDIDKASVVNVPAPWLKRALAENP